MNDSTQYNQEYDVAIIGGGINGVSLARELSLRNLKVILIEKNDFGYGTSSLSSKLAHGGLRYLKQAHFKLVFEALRERHLLLNSAPHLVKPMPFLFPVYKGILSNFILKMGMLLYDMLSFQKTLPNHSFFTSKTLGKLSTCLNQSKLNGVAKYYDAIMNDAKLCIEIAQESSLYGATLLSYSEVIKIHTNNSKISHLSCLDNISGKKFCIKAKYYASCTGPWTDKLLKLFNKKLPNYLNLSKGIHLVTKPIPIKESIVISTNDNRIFFVIPWDNYSIIGTTDTLYHDNLDSINITKDEVLYLIKQVNYYVPNLNLTYHDIFFTFAGLRPLLVSNKKIGTSSREHSIIQNHNLFSIIGGKYTTFRSMTEEMAKKIISVARPNDTFIPMSKNLNSYGGYIKNINQYIQLNFKKDSDQFNIDKNLYSHIIHFYGSQYRNVLNVFSENNDYKSKLIGTDHYCGEVIYSIRYEFCKTITDFLRRRTQISFSKNNGIQCLNQVANLFQKELNWSLIRYQSEIKHYKQFISKSSIDHILANSD
ncbi:hypothetical protein DID75_02400 [Candidatus Marinamargulisbacteria bacterium SCGC AG-410-N11]|nr:hypothetical protein DID75_02400 [Candidatus Marinamargulisbacteria bacterium SCGC AG-410-N11]